MPEKDTEIMTQYDDYTVEELRAALQRVFMFSDLTDADMDEMDKILSVLREKAPFDHPHTTEEMWERFAAEHAEELASLGIPKNEDTEEVIEKKPEETTAPPETTVQRARYIWPTPGYTEITSYFGGRYHPITGQWNSHSGVDIGAPYWTPVLAIAADGTMASLAEKYVPYGLVKENVTLIG